MNPDFLPPRTEAERRKQKELQERMRKQRRLLHWGFVVLLVIAILWGLRPTVSHAEIFTCRDDSGRMLTSDKPIPECAKRDVRVLRADGATKEVIAAPLTEEQKRQREAQAEVQRVKANQERERQMRDRALLNAYSDIGALESARKRQLDELQAEIDAAYKRINFKEPELKSAVAELEFYKGKKVPGMVNNKIQIAANAILVEDELVRAKQAEAVSINQRFNADAKRLRELLDPSTGRVAQATKH
jgi:hypothetical protein